MSAALVRHIPSGAEITVTLKNGKSFKGFEDSSPQEFEEGILRITRPVGRDPDGDTLVFATPHDQVACYELLNIA